MARGGTSPPQERARGARVPPLSAKTSLVVVDPQRLFCDPASPAYLPAWARACPNLLALAEGFLASGRGVHVTAHLSPQDLPDPAFDALFARRLAPGDPLAALLPPFDGWPAGRRLEKPRFSLFSCPRAEEALAGTRHLVLAGATTNLCVLASCLDAAARGFVPVVVADACAARSEALHEAALATIASGHGFVADTAAVLAALPAAGRLE